MPTNERTCPRVPIRREIIANQTRHPRIIKIQSKETNSVTSLSTRRYVCESRGLNEIRMRYRSASFEHRSDELVLSKGPACIALNSHCAKLVLIKCS